MTLGETQSVIQLELILHALEAMLTDEEEAPNTFLFFCTPLHKRVSWKMNRALSIPKVITNYIKI